MRQLNFRFAAVLAAVLAALAVGTYGLHCFQHGRIARSIWWQVETARAAGDTDKAIRYAYQYLEFAPDDARAMAELAGWVEQRGVTTGKELIRVITLFEKVLRLDPGRDDLRRKLADLNMTGGRWGEAIDHLEQLLRSGPDAELYDKLADCLQAIGKYSEAAANYQRSMRADPSRATTYLAYATLLQNQLGRPDDARSVIEEVVRKCPDNAEARIGYARYLRYARRMGEAEREAREAVRLGADSVTALVLCAEIEQANGKFRSARERLNAALALAPKNPRIAAGLAWLTVAEGKTEEAVRVIQEALKDNPRSVELLTLLGDVLAREGKVEQLERVVADLEAAGGAPPERDGNVRYLRARLHLRGGDLPKAVEALEQLRSASARAPGLAKQTNYLLARAYVQLFDGDNAVSSYRRILEADPAAAFYRMEYARDLTRLGRIDDAVREYRDLAQRTDLPIRDWADFTQQFTAAALRGDARTRREFEKTIDALKPDERAIPAVLAKVELDRARGRSAEALALLDRQLTLHPNHLQLHLAKIRALDTSAGLDRAMTALAAAERQFGDQADLRIARIRLLSWRLGESAAAVLPSLIRGTEAMAADDRCRVASELINALAATGDVAGAEQCLRLIRALKPDHTAAREVLFVRAARTANAAEMDQLLQEIAEVEGAEGAIGQRLRAVRAVLGGQTESAKPLIAACLLRRPGDPIAELLNGYLAETDGRGDAAMVHYRAAIDHELLEHPVEELLTALTANAKAGGPGRVLLIESPLADRIRCDRDRGAIHVMLSHCPEESTTRLIERVFKAVPLSEPVQAVWAAKQARRHGAAKRADDLLAAVTRAHPRWEEGWLARMAAAGPDRLPGLISEARAALPSDEAYAILGRCLEAARRTDLAEQEYRAAIERRPHDTRARRMLATMLLQTGSATQARSVLRDLVDVPQAGSTDDVRWARRTLAVHLTRTPSLAAFRESIQLLDANAPPTDDDLRARALVFASQKGRDLPQLGHTARREAIRILEQLESRSPPRSPENLLQLARLYRAEGDAENLQRVNDALARSFSDQYAAAAHLARTALRDGRPADAERWVNRADELDAVRFETVALRFELKARSGDAAGAVGVTREYVEKAGAAELRAARSVRAADLIDDFLQTYPLAENPAVAGRLRDAAIELYTPHVVGDPHRLARLVTLLCRGDRVGTAIEWIQANKARLSPEGAAAGLLAVLRSGRASAAQVKTIERSILEQARSQPNSLALRLCAADCFDLTGQPAKAEAVYRDVLAKDPENLVALNNLAWILSYDRGKIAESLQLVQRAIDAHGPLDELLDTRARIRSEAGQPEAGLRDLSEALAEAPTAARYFNLALAYRRTDRPRQAEEAIAQAKQYGLSRADLHPRDEPAWRQLMAQ